MREWLSFEPDRTSIAQLVLVGTVVVALVLSGSLVPGVSLTQSGPDSLDEGNVTVSNVAVDVESVVITPGRFGTNVSYVRVPDAEITVQRTQGQPRVVYQLAIPELGIDHSEPKLLTKTGRTTVRIDPMAIQPAQLSKDSYEGQVTVRVQSYTVDRVVYNASISVEVER